MSKPALPARKTPGSWVQTDRKTHELWAQLSVQSPKAGALLHLLAARVGEHNAVVMSHAIMADLLGCSRDTIKRALAELRARNWLEVRQLTSTGTANAYVLNDRVAWTQARDGLRYSLFSAAVVVSADVQPDRDELGDQPPLRKLPRMLEGERQVAAGEGLPPPSEPSLPGLEVDLPTLRDREPREEPVAIGAVMPRLDLIAPQEDGE